VWPFRASFALALPTDSAPIFLLGYAASGATPNLSLLFLFLLIHIGLYGGATAYNSYYDRDEGPIGGMKYPLVVGDLELYGGLTLQVLALLGLLFWGVYMCLGGLAMLLMGIAYSHPRWRWKARPVLGLLMVTCGQGLIPFFMGLMAALPRNEPVAAPAILLTAAAEALIITGLYPLTQVYQIAEDRRRGDHTFAAHFGPRITFRFSRLLVGFGLVLMAWLALYSSVLPRLWAGLIPFGYLAFFSILTIWSKRFPHQTVYQNHDWSFGISLGMSSMFWVLLSVEFLRRSIRWS
jgi:1,4-dihydroxy-2-naphthoate octaprenyltransferase